MKNSALFFFIAPIALSLLGILGNVISFISSRVNQLNFVFSVAYLIFWLVLFYFAPKVNIYSLHIYYLTWWFLSLVFSLKQVFSYYLTGEISYSWDIVFNIIFITPIFGLQYPFQAGFIFNCIIVAICFFLFTIAICQMFIAKNMKNKYKVI